MFHTSKRPVMKAYMVRSYIDIATHHCAINPDPSAVGDLNRARKELASAETEQDLRNAAVWALHALQESAGADHSDYRRSMSRFAHTVQPD